ncbi:MAG: helix-turn-helix domain-containing protein [Bacteroidales bacterium]
MKQEPINTEIFIKNMVCPRCIMVVNKCLTKQHLTIISIELGKAVVKEYLSNTKKNIIAKELELLGFELLSNKKTKIIERIKNVVIAFVHYQKNNLHQNLSDYIAYSLHQEYSYLSKIFSEHENSTIEQYFIAQKIEKVKELLSYGELTLNEIAYSLNYSSSAYLSTQFKQITGMTPSKYKTMTHKNRKSLDAI